MPLDQEIVDILEEKANALNRSQTEIEVRVSSGSYDIGRFYVYDVQFFSASHQLGKHVLRISHASPGPSFPVEMTFADPAQPSKDIAASPEMLAEKVRQILTDALKP